MKASDYIVSFLEANGIEYVFGYQGGMITHLVDSISKSRKVKYVQCYHEQSAAFAAEGYARASGKFGVCITTSGPGATNAITGVGNAYFDSIPVLYITGQVNSYEYKYSSPIRQKGFQETDIVSMVKPVVKFARLADDPARLADDLAEAVGVMLSGRKGPALIDLPMNIQRADITGELVPPRIAKPAVADADVLQSAIKALAGAKRPLVLCGGGLADLEAQVAARRFLKSTCLPYVVSLMGKGLVDEQSAQCAGMIGSYGNRCANLSMAEADVVLALGSRLDLRQTGNRASKLLKDKLFIRIDIDEIELRESQLPLQQAVHAGVADFCAAYESCGGEIGASAEWTARVEALKRQYAQAEDVRRHVTNRLPYEVLECCAPLVADDALFVADIGQNQMWAAQTIRCGANQRFYTSGGMAPMGYAVPAAAGAAFANPGRQIVCFSGDGGFHIAVQSLLLVAQYRLPVAVVVFNNHALGMITQFQKLYFNGNMAGTVDNGGYLVPDLEHLAAAYGLEYAKVRSAAEISPALLAGPRLVEVDMGGGETSVVPKLQFDHDLDDMSPPFDAPMPNCV